MIKLYFADHFSVSPQVIAEYGAFNISLITDLPLFIDPFLLFNSKKAGYQRLHEGKTAPSAPAKLFLVN